MPEFVGLGGCGFAFGLEFGAFCLPGFYGEGFMEAGEFTFGQVEAAEFWFVGLLKLLPAFFEFDLLQLVIDRLGFCSKAIFSAFWSTAASNFAALIDKAITFWVTSSCKVSTPFPVKRGYACSPPYRS